MPYVKYIIPDNVASLMAKTFFALLELSDMSPATSETLRSGESSQDKSKASDAQSVVPLGGSKITHPTGLHYNIQIHLPATKDVEVYNSIFKSIKEHLLNE